MEKLFLLFLLTGAVLQCSSQNTFAPVGAEWWYYEIAYEWEGETNFTFNTKSTGDTMIAGTLCRKLVTDIRKQTNSNWGGFDAYAKDFFYYDNTDTVFIYNENFGRFTPLYIFNAEEGDTICLPIPPTPNGHADLRVNPISGDTSFCFVIDSVRVRLYDNSPLKTFYTRALFEKDVVNSQPIYPAYNWGGAVSYSDNPVTGKYIEHIIGDFSPSRIISCVDCWSYNYAPHGELRCYSDSSYNIRMTAFSCDSLPPLGINKLISEQMSIPISPNPSSGMFSIRWQQPLSAEVHIVVTDIFGERIAAATVPAGNTTYSLDLSREPAGMYLLRLSNNNSYVYKKLILQHTAEK